LHLRALLTLLRWQTFFLFARVVLSSVFFFAPARAGFADFLAICGTTARLGAGLAAELT
jgi:hypothetical protein